MNFFQQINKTPRPIQVKASNAMEKNDRGILNIFCGVGKSLIILSHIYDTSKDTISIIIVPSKTLANQFEQAPANDQ
ncbi:MAG: DEAD/DEAH box helicase family protein [Clostridium sp.]